MKLSNLKHSANFALLLLPFRDNARILALSKDRKEKLIDLIKYLGNVDSYLSIVNLLESNEYDIKYSLSEICNEKTKNNKYTQRLIYKQLKKDMNIIYKNDNWIIKNIHYENAPDIYFTIKNEMGREIQTIKSNINLQ